MFKRGIQHNKSASFARRFSFDLDKLKEKSVSAYQKSFCTQPLFLKKDVAEFVEARKVTRSF